jgi:hypothetical protein
MHQQALQLMEKVLGQEHPLTLASMNNLALVLRSQGKHEEAETILHAKWHKQPDYRHPARASIKEAVDRLTYLILLSLPP